MHSKPIVLVCVTGQKTCDRLIQVGSTLANEKDAPLFVLHVAKKDAPLLGEASDSDALNYLYALATEAEAEMTVKRAEAPNDAICAYAKTIGASNIVLGANPQDTSGQGMVHQLKKLLPDVLFHVITA